MLYDIKAMDWSQRVEFDMDMVHSYIVNAILGSCSLQYGLV
jgi:hypothetical protein